MKPMGMFVSTILVVDTFFVSYYLALHSRSVPVIDPTMKPIEQTAPKPVPAAKPHKDAKADSAKPKVDQNKKPAPKTTAKTTAKTKKVHKDKVH